jgi:hypothetical protein
MAGKKRSVWLCGTAALIAMAAVSVPAAGAPPGPADFSPPRTQLLLTRTLHRPLPDGKEVITRRSYAVHIVPQAEGYRVEGSLVEARVEAPPILAALAEIERRRPDSGIFPILLDAKGMIVGGGGPFAEGPLGQAAVVAAETIGNSGLPAPDMLQAQEFVRQLPGRAPRNLWPNDIFHPVPGSRRESRTIALPGGGEGNVTIDIETQGPSQGGQIALLDRVVTTELAGDRRVTREQWQLSRDPGDPGR